VAISHPPPLPTDTAFDLGTSKSTTTLESSRRTHTRAPSSHISSSGPRYSPVSSSFSRKGSPRADYECLPPEDRGYHISPGPYTPNPGSTPRYNATYYPNATYEESTAYPQGPNGHLPNGMAAGVPFDPCYSDPSLSMNPAMVQNNANFSPQGSEYLSWNPTVPNQLYYARYASL
jgi:hypothetical protein